MKRPTSVSVISWFLIISGIISIAASYYSFSNPLTKELMARSLLPVSIQYVLMFVGILVTVVSGFAMLKGVNWSRQLYLGWSVIGMVIGLATAPIKVGLIPGAVLMVVIGFFLYRPKANAYFTQPVAANDA
jgi:hypothetical protein